MYVIPFFYINEQVTKLPFIAQIYDYMYATCFSPLGSSSGFCVNIFKMNVMAKHEYTLCCEIAQLHVIY
jgi:hypothetical protein